MNEFHDSSSNLLNGKAINHKWENPMPTLELLYIFEFNFYSLNYKMELVIFSTHGIK